jgi:hypothetical protein
MIGSKTGAPTAAHLWRWAEVWDLGCIACRLAGLGWVAPEQDHRNVGDLAGMPRTEGGHDDTLGLCCWHHRGIPFAGWTAERCLREAGPSKQLHKRAFLERFGSIEELHAQQLRRLERYRERTRISPKR